MRKILLAVDGSQRGLETVSILGRLLKDQEDMKIVLLHCVQQISTLLPEDLCMDIEETSRLPFKDQEKVGQAVLRASLSRLTDAGFPEADIELRLKLDSLDPALDIIDQADIERIRTIAVGRRGRSQLEALLLGSISGKVAQYARDKIVWIVDTPVNDSMKVLIAMEGVPEVRELSYYTAELFGPCPGLSYTFMHIMPPVPPKFWDDGHILDCGGTERQAGPNRKMEDRVDRLGKPVHVGGTRSAAGARSRRAERGKADTRDKGKALRGTFSTKSTRTSSRSWSWVRKASANKSPSSWEAMPPRYCKTPQGVILCLVS